MDLQRARKSRVIATSALFPLLFSLQSSAVEPTGEASSPVSEAAMSEAAIPLKAATPVNLAPEPHRLEWRWRRFGLPDYALTAAFGLGYLYVELGMGPADHAHWRGGIAFDGAVRRALVAKSRRGRDHWATASDVLALIPQGMMLIDSLFVPLLSDDWNTDVALQMSSMAAQSEALTGLVSRLGQYGVARERPDTVPCRRDSAYSASCYRGTTASFPGGHVAGAMVGAGIVCAHHLHLPLYGQHDLAACLSNVGIALTAGYARIAADRHYLSDILAGAALGAGAGLLLPSLLYYGFAGEANEAPNRAQSSVFWTLTPLQNGDARGLAISGWF